MKSISFTPEMAAAVLDGRKCQDRRPINPQPDPFEESVYTPTIITPGETGHTGPNTSDHVFLNHRESEYKGHRQRPWNEWEVECDPLEDPYRARSSVRCPFGKPGDRLWLRETWRIGAWRQDDHGFRFACDYRGSPEIKQTPWNTVEGASATRLLDQCHNDAERAVLADETGERYWEDDGYHWEAGDSPCRWRSPATMPQWASRATLIVKRVWVERVQDISEQDARAEGLTLDGWWRNGLSNMHGAEYCYHTHIEAFADLWDSIYAKRGMGWEVNPWVWCCEWEVER